MIDQIAEAFEREGYEVDAEETRLVVLRSNGKPVLELDWTSCDLTEADLARISRAFAAAG